MANADVISFPSRKQWHKNYVVQPMERHPVRVAITDDPTLSTLQKEVQLHDLFIVSNDTYNNKSIPQSLSSLMVNSLQKASSM